MSAIAGTPLHVKVYRTTFTFFFHFQASGIPPPNPVGQMPVSSFASGVQPVATNVVPPFPPGLPVSTCFFVRSISLRSIRLTLNKNLEMFKKHRHAEF